MIHYWYDIGYFLKVPALWELLPTIKRTPNVGLVAGLLSRINHFRRRGEDVRDKSQQREIITDFGGTLAITRLIFSILKVKPPIRAGNPNRRYHVHISSIMQLCNYAIMHLALRDGYITIKLIDDDKSFIKLI